MTVRKLARVLLVAVGIFLGFVPLNTNASASPTQDAPNPRRLAPTPATPRLGPRLPRPPLVNIERRRRRR